jgi:hypothetical protein
MFVGVSCWNTLDVQSGLDNLRPNNLNPCNTEKGYVCFINLVIRTFDYLKAKWWFILGRINES